MYHLPLDLRNSRGDSGIALAQLYSEWEMGMVGYQAGQIHTAVHKIELLESCQVGDLLNISKRDSGRLLARIADQGDKLLWANAAALEAGQAGDSVKIVVRQGFVPISVSQTAAGVQYFLGSNGKLSTSPGAQMVQPIAIGCAGGSFYFDYHSPSWREDATA